MSDAVNAALTLSALGNAVLLMAASGSPMRKFRKEKPVKWTEKVVDTSETGMLTIWMRDKDGKGRSTEYCYQPRCTCGWRSQSSDGTPTGTWFKAMVVAREEAVEHRCADLNIFFRPRWSGVAEKVNPDPVEHRNEAIGRQLDDLKDRLLGMKGISQ